MNFFLTNCEESKSEKKIGGGGGGGGRGGKCFVARQHQNICRDWKKR